MKIIKETWKNKDGDREDHYWLDNARKKYLFGFNPEVIRKKPRIIFDILRILIGTVDKM